MLDDNAVVFEPANDFQRYIYETSYGQITCDEKERRSADFEISFHVYQVTNPDVKVVLDINGALFRCCAPYSTVLTVSVGPYEDSPPISALYLHMTRFELMSDKQGSQRACTANSVLTAIIHACHDRGGYSRLYLNDKAVAVLRANHTRELSFSLGALTTITTLVLRGYWEEFNSWYASRCFRSILE